MSEPSSTRHKLTGICPVARGAVLAALVRAHPATVWLVIADELKIAEQLAEDVAFFHAAAPKAGALQVLIFPESQPDSRDMREAFAASSDSIINRAVSAILLLTRPRRMV
jgi:transcription-repair coupling factor (superfamily II helicase)